MPDPDPANHERLAAALAQLGGEHPISEALTGEALARPASMKVLTFCGEVHVLNRMPGTAPFGELRVPSGCSVEIDPGVLAPVCSLRHLRAMKRASDRPRDSVDLAELDELHGPE